MLCLAYGPVTPAFRIFAMSILWNRDGRMIELFWGFGLCSSLLDACAWRRLIRRGGFFTQRIFRSVARAINLPMLLLYRLN
jgi:hypothetical protein